MVMSTELNSGPSLKEPFLLSTITKKFILSYNPKESVSDWNCIGTLCFSNNCDRMAICFALKFYDIINTGLT